jgi:hypothetical protein
MTEVVQSTVVPAVLSIEGALATANLQVDTYCAARHLSVTLCFETGVDPYDTATVTLAQVFRRQALLLGGTSPALATQLAALRLVNPLLNAQMEALIEDLALCSDQLIALLQDYAGPLLALGQVPPAASQSGTIMRGLAYAARVRILLTVLRRAAQWLETIDRETGARLRLPGFEGSSGLAARLAAP